MSDELERLAAARPPTPPAISPELEAELSRLSQVSPRRPARQLAILACLSLAYGAGVLAMLHLRVDLGELPVGFVVAAALAWFVGFAVPSYLALVPRADAVMPRVRWAAASAIITSITFVALGLVIHPNGPHSRYYGWPRFVHGHTCLEIGLATALLPVLIGAIFLRGALPVGSRWVAAALGAASGCLGGLILHLHCPIADAPHVALIHGGVVVVAALLSAAVVPRATDRPLR